MAVGVHRNAGNSRRPIAPAPQGNKENNNTLPPDNPGNCPSVKV